MSSERLDSTFELIYRTFNRHGRSIRQDTDRHPEHTEDILNRLGRPDRSATNILVTGSKGKGSTAALIAGLLGRSNGVGLFVSPHLIDSLERIRVNGKMISEDNFSRVFELIREPAEAVVSALPTGHYVGPVGFYAVMAAQYFKECGVRWAVYETGRGALYDDVSRIHHQVAVITRLYLEHRRELGPDLEHIAWHKAGAITPETQLVVLGSRDAVLRHAVEQRIRTLHSAPTVVETADVCQVEVDSVGTAGTVLSVRFADGRHWHNLRMPAVGALVDNLATAIAVVEQLNGPLPYAVVADVVAQFRWPGRGEIVRHRPVTLLDAGVRPESVEPILTSLGRFEYVVLSIPEGKERDGMIALLRTFADHLVLTGCSNPRLSYRFDDLPARHGLTVIPDVNQALAEVDRRASPTSRIFWCGTLSFVADAYRWLGRQVP